jgi:hypothetical protein
VDLHPERSNLRDLGGRDIHGRAGGTAVRSDHLNRQRDHAGGMSREGGTENERPKSKHAGFLQADSHTFTQQQVYNAMWNVE